MEQQRRTAVTIPHIPHRSFADWRHISNPSCHSILKLVCNGKIVLRWSHEVCWGRIQPSVRSNVPKGPYFFELYCQYWTKLADAELEKQYIEYVLSLAPGVGSLVEEPPADQFGSEQAHALGYLLRYATVRYEITSRKTYQQAFAMHTLLRYLMEFPDAVASWPKLSEWLGDRGKAIMLISNGCEKPRAWSGHSFSPELSSLKSLKYFDLKLDVFDQFPDDDFATLWSHVWRHGSWSFGHNCPHADNPVFCVFTKELCDLFMEEETHTPEWKIRRDRLIGEANAKKYEPVSIGNI